MVEGAGGLLFDQAPDCARQARGPSRRADLVGHHAKLVTLLHQPNHGAHEIGAASLVDPGGAHQHVFRAQMILALGLGAAIGRLRIARRIRNIGRRGSAVEDIVGRNVDHLPAGLGHGFDHRGDGFGIDRAGEVFIALGLVDRSIGGGVQDQVGRFHRQPRTQHRHVGEIAVIDVDRVDLGPCGREALQGAAELTVRAGDQHPHANTGTSARASPRASFSEMIGSSPVTGHSIPTAGSFHASVNSFAGA